MPSFERSIRKPYASADKAKPSPHDPCNTPDIRPRERAGQDSIASAAPAGHSAPIPMPSSARVTNRKVKVGESPASKLHTEYHRIEIISGARRPKRSANQPEAVAPPSRMTRVTEKTAVTSMIGTPNSCAIGAIMSRKTVKSNASSVHPIHAAKYAYHWSLVGSFHHGTVAAREPYPDMVPVPHFMLQFIGHDLAPRRGDEQRNSAV